MSGKKWAYGVDDDDQDKAVDKGLEAGTVPDVVEPDDLKAIAEQPTAQELAAPKVDLATLSDEALTAELARRRTGKIDAEIEATKAHLAELEAERTALLSGQPAPVRRTTTVNPITGKPRTAVGVAPMPVPPVDPNRPKPPKPGTVLTKDCSCKGAGCYLCMVIIGK